jgi:hypothetical protein
MPAYCHNNRPPLYAGGPARPENDQGRLPEPSPPPWVNCRTPPADFYRPIFGAGRGLALVTAGPIAPGEGER